MTKHNDLTCIRRYSLLSALVILAATLTRPPYCRGENIALLLQQTPARAGMITPSAGVHHFAPNTQITLTAVPKPGFQFVYWLGDVSDPTANNTLAYLDSPKIIIAVFERNEYAFLADNEYTDWVPSPRLIRIPADYARGGGGGGGGKRGNGGGGGGNGNGNGEEPDDFPVPIPEPATVVLLSLATLFAFARRPRYTNAR